MNHLCKNDDCLTCQLGFLFNNIYICKSKKISKTTATTNFIRILRKNENAILFGLIEKKNNFINETSLKLINFNRFITSLIYNEMIDDSIYTSKISNFKKLYTDIIKSKTNFIDQLLGSDISTILKCSSCQTEIKKEQHVFIYPLATSTGLNNKSFESILYRTFNNHEKIKTWCITCNKFKQLEKYSKLLNYPNIFNFEISLDEKVINNFIKF
jgi:hypothetical protein